MAIILWVIITIIIIIALWAMMSFNHLVVLKNRTKEALSDIDVQSKRRYDLIPNLMETVKGYAAHESQIFEKVTLARTAAMGATGLKDKAVAENALSGTLKSLFAVAENYPDLKASTNFLALQNELTDTEDKIEAARRFYNGNVRDLNTAIEVFPGNVVAGMFHFSQMELFAIDENEAAAKKPVNVKF